jgi:electron transfer flavoprotein alpha/beta subunit
MNIVVCVKYVPDATADRQFEDDNTVDRVGVDGLLSELDEYAVEQALQIKEKAGEDTEVTVLTVGPEQATDAIRKGLQMGADKAVHVVDDAIAGSDAPGLKDCQQCCELKSNGLGKPTRGGESPVDMDEQQGQYPEYHAAR